MFVPSRGAKNYILWHEDGKITTKGSWRKRDRSRLEKEFPLNLSSAPSTVTQRKMVVWGFDIGDRYLQFRPFCIKMILNKIQKSEITDCDTGGCGMWV